MALPTYATPLERIWHWAYLAICTLIFIFLIAPILIIIPLSFNTEPYFTFTPEMLSQIFDLRAAVMADPHHGAPIVLPR